MGIRIGFSNSTYNKNPISTSLFGGRISNTSYNSSPNIKDANNKLYQEYDVKLDDPNPNPRYYQINKIYEFQNGYVMDITYPNCKNYEGRKILVYRGGIEDHASEFMRHGIDPHFCEVPYAPIARFEPTEEGLKMAKKIAKELYNENN